jgi:hypothetical protein
LQLTPQQVIDLKDKLDKTELARNGATKESELLRASRDALQDRLTRLNPTNVAENPKLPAGLKGQVVAVDPKFGFVILNIGNNKGVLTNGVMMIARDGNLIGKVQISGVEDTQSVANILPAWRRGEVMEGDEVLY